MGLNLALFSGVWEAKAAATFHSVCSCMTPHVRVFSWTAYLQTECVCVCEVSCVKQECFWQPPLDLWFFMYSLCMAPRIWDSRWVRQCHRLVECSVICCVFTLVVSLQVATLFLLSVKFGSHCHCICWAWPLTSVAGFLSHLYMCAFHLPFTLKSQSCSL